MKTSPNKGNAKSNRVLKILLDKALLLLTVAAIFFVLWAPIYWVNDMPPVPRSKAAKVVPGMSKAEVEALLGKPKNISRSSEAKWECWVYKKPTRLTTFAVYYSGEGKVTSTQSDN